MGRRTTGSLLAAALLATALTTLAPAHADALIAGTLVRSDQVAADTGLEGSPILSASDDYVLHNRQQADDSRPPFDTVVRGPIGWNSVRTVDAPNSGSNYAPKLIDDSIVQVLESGVGGDTHTYRVEDAGTGTVQWTADISASVYVHGDDQWALVYVNGAAPGTYQLKFVRFGQPAVLASSTTSAAPQWVGGDSSVAFVRAGSQDLKIDAITGTVTPITFSSPSVRLDVVTTTSVVGIGPTPGTATVEFRDRSTLVAGISFSYAGDVNASPLLPFGAGLAVTYHDPAKSYREIQLRPVTTDGTLGAPIASNLVGMGATPTGTGKLVYISAASQAGRITYASAPSTIEGGLDLPKRYREITDIGLSKGKVLATFNDLDDTPWTHATNPDVGIWQNTYAANHFGINQARTLIYGGDVVASRDGLTSETAHVGWPGGSRSFGGYPTDLILSNDGTYLAWNYGTDHYRVENAKTGVQLKLWTGARRLLDDGRVWRGPDSTGKLIGYDVTGQRADRVITITMPCPTADPSDLRGRWLLLRCGDDMHAVDLLKKLPTRSVSGAYTYSLGGGFLGWIKAPALGETPVVQVLDLASGQSKSFGPIRFGTYDGPRLAADRGGAPQLAYVDPQGQARVVDLAPWFDFQPWTAGGQSPTNVTAARGDKVAVISWTPPVPRDTAITSYTVTSVPDGKTVTVPATSSGAKLTGLVLGRSYTFTVTAKDAAGTGAPSRKSNSIVFAGKPGVPPASTGVSGRTAAIHWRAPSSNGTPITKYVVHLDSHRVTVSNTTRSYYFKSLPRGYHKISVTAVNAVGASGTRWLTIKI